MPSRLMFAFSILFAFGCGDTTNQPPNESRSAGRATSASQAANAKFGIDVSEKSYQNLDRALRNVVEAVRPGQSSLPLLSDGDSTDLSIVLSSEFVLSVLQDDPDDVGRRGHSLSILRQLARVIEGYDRIISEEQAVQSEYVAAIRQLLEVAAIAGPLMPESSTGDLPLKTEEIVAAMSVERTVWGLGMYGRTITKPFHEYQWSLFSNDQKVELLSAVASHGPKLGQGTFKNCQTVILTALADLSDSDDEAVNEQLAKTVQAIKEAPFRPHLLDAPSHPFDVSAVAVPTFPLNEGIVYTIDEADDTFVVEEFRVSAKPNSTAGFNGEFRVLVPEGEHADGSLPCILRAPAGTDLESGSGLGLDEESVYLAESMPYLKAGYAVVEYSLDGEEQEDLPGLLTGSRIAYMQFRAAMAGMVNTRNAIAVAKTVYPQIDPERIYVSGHSSAANVALLAAAHFAEIKGVIAFAPAPDVVESNYSLTAHDSSIKPGAHSFRIKSAPLTHAGHINCPVFLFHSEKDNVVPIEQSEDFEAQLRRLGKNVTFVKVKSPGHYDPMIETGFDQAIKWLKSQDATAAVNTDEDRQGK